MGKTSAKKGSKRSKVDRASKRHLAKAQAAATNAQHNVTIVTKQLSEAVRALMRSQAGSPKEAQSAKNVRAATKGFVAARKKLRKAEKKRKKARARLLETTKRSVRAGSKARTSRQRAARKTTSPASKERPRTPKRAARKGKVAATVVAAPNLSGGGPQPEAITLPASEASHQVFHHPED